MNEITSTKSKVQIWQEWIEAQVKSGQSIRAFCEEQHINCHTFHYWKGKFKDWKCRSLTNRFISIGREASLASILPRIHLPNGVRIELGASLESVSVGQFILKLCGVSDAKS
jgi:hypothetical protein